MYAEPQKHMVVIMCMCVYVYGDVYRVALNRTGLIRWDVIRLNSHMCVYGDVYRVALNRTGLIRWDDAMGCGVIRIATQHIVN